MTLLWLSILWVFASALVALMPMRRQYAPGVALLVSAPVLIIWIGSVVGWWASVLALAAFVSMYRNPLRYLYAKFTGRPVSVPTPHDEQERAT